MLHTYIKTVAIIFEHLHAAHKIRLNTEARVFGLNQPPDAFDKRQFRIFMEQGSGFV